jgi:hypothetical protein
MKNSKMLAAMLCCSMSMTVGALAQPKQPEKPKAPDTKQPADMKKDMKAPPGMDSAEMEAMMKAGAPGPMHAWMAEHMAGTWDANCKFWMKPDAPMTESKGVMVSEMMWENRYCHSKFTGEMNMGEGMKVPFEGAALMCYDNITEKFQSLWIDSMSTGVMSAKGSLSADKMTLTLNGECMDPQTKKASPTREVYKFMGADKFVMEMHCTKDGKEWKCMEITYTKSAGAMKEKSSMDKMKDEAAKKAAEEKAKKNTPAK